MGNLIPAALKPEPAPTLDDIQMNCEFEARMADKKSKRELKRSMKQLQNIQANANIPDAVKKVYVNDAMQAQEASVAAVNKASTLRSMSATIQQHKESAHEAIMLHQMSRAMANQMTVTPNRAEKITKKFQAQLDQANLAGKIVHSRIAEVTQPSAAVKQQTEEAMNVIVDMRELEEKKALEEMEVAAVETVAASSVVVAASPVNKVVLLTDRAAVQSPRPVSVDVQFRERLVELSRSAAEAAVAAPTPAPTVVVIPTKKEEESNSLRPLLTKEQQQQAASAALYNLG